MMWTLWILSNTIWSFLHSDCVPKFSQRHAMGHNQEITYIDSILIYSPNLEFHVTHVKEVLSSLMKNHQYIKAEKCELHVSKVTFLVYVISAVGVTMDKEKISTVSTWPQSTSIKELQQFIGFAYFFECFIQGFSDILDSDIANRTVM